MARFYVRDIPGVLKHGRRVVFFVLLWAALLTGGCTGSDSGSPSLQHQVKTINSGSKEEPHALVGMSDMKSCSPLIDELEQFAENDIDISACRSVIGANVPKDAFVVVRIDVSADGKVGSVGITSSTYPHKVFEGCLLRTIRQTGFPPPGKDVVIHVGFPLRSDSDEKNNN